jgi:transcriptional regulator with XRE-family HTH domain
VPPAGLPGAGVFLWGWKVLTKTLRQWRHERLLTLVRLAERAGVAYRTVQGVERGDRVPTLKTIERLCAALEVNPRDVEEFARALELRGASYNNRAA